MNKNLLLTLSALALSAASMLAANVPYSSDFYNMSNGQLDDGWTALNLANRAQSWTWDNINQLYTNVEGAKAGAYKPYDPDYSANCWLISPDIALESGKTYTMKVMARGRGSYESEKLAIMLGTYNADDAQNVSGLNKTIYRNEAFKEYNNFIEIKESFQVDATGNYNIGIQCYSDAGQYDVYMTQFSITEGNGGDTPGVDAKTLPWTADISQAGSQEWTTYKDEHAMANTEWAYDDEYEAFVAFADWMGLEQDAWLISPALNFSQAGAYAINAKLAIGGGYQIALGTDPDDVSSFTNVIYDTDSKLSNLADFKFAFNVENPGVYYLAFRAKEDGNSDDYDYWVKALSVDAYNCYPMPIADLAASKDDDALKVTLNGTYPSLDNNDQTLTALGKAEVYRNGDLIHTINDATPGAPFYFEETLPAIGQYTYMVKVFSPEGTTAEENVMTASIFVGRPTITLPYSAEASDLYGNMDGWIMNGWENIYSSGYPYGYFLTSETDESGNPDHWMITPWVHLTPGTYKLTSYINANSQGYEIGLVTDRDNYVGTFTAFASVNNETEYGANKREFFAEVTTEGDYAIAFHHNRGSAGYYNSVKISDISFRESLIVPATAANLQANEVSEAVVKLTWTNPSVTNTNEDLASISKVEVNRNGELIGTVEDAVPGEQSEFIDNEPVNGTNLYTVVVYNENGVQEDQPASVEFKLHMAEPMPYECTDFHAWEFLGYYPDWKLLADGSMHNPGAYSDYVEVAASPFFNFVEGEKYILKIEFAERAADVMIKTGVERENYACELHHTIPVSTEADDIATLTLVASNVDTPDAQSDEAQTSEIMIPAGKRFIGLDPNGEGQKAVTVKSVRLSKDVPSGVRTIWAAGEGISFANGIVYLPEGCESYSVYDLAGRSLMSGNQLTVDLRGLNGVVIVKAIVKGQARSIKVNL